MNSDPVKRKIKVFGKDVDVVEVPFEPIVEHFNEYKLEDGSVIKVKAVAVSVMRVDDQFMPDGSPVYIVLTSPAVKVMSSTLKNSGDEGVVN